MRGAYIRFDDPDDPAKPSALCVELSMRLMTLDFARRSFERKDDETSRRRAKELRQYFRKAILDSVTVVRSIIPEDILAEHCHIEVQRAMRIEEEQRETRKKLRRLQKLESKNIEDLSASGGMK